MKDLAEIRLRAVEPEDVDFILSCENNPEAASWSDYRAPLSREQLLAYALTYDADPFSAGQLRLIITASERPVGILDIYGINEKDSRAYIGICIHPDNRRRGFAKAALEKLIEFNREKLGLRQLLAKISTLNPNSIRLFKNLGFKEIALLPEWHRIGIEFHDFLLLSRSATTKM